MTACEWCDEPAAGGVFCSKRCRQTAWRARELFRDVARGIANPGPVVRVLGKPRSSANAVRVAANEAAKAEKIRGFDGRPRRLGVFDPPYPGRAFLYKREASYAGEVDHVALVESLSGYDGWVLATSAEALPRVLAMCPVGTRVASWTKPHGVQRTTRGPGNVWEPILYRPAREFEPGFPDAIVAQPARGGGTLMGRKPIAWVAFAIRLLGALPHDQLEDPFPGTGVVGRVWRQFARAVGDANLEALATRRQEQLHRRRSAPNQIRRRLVKRGAVAPVPNEGAAARDGGGCSISDVAGSRSKRGARV
jgi:hypothetical protein